MSKRQRIRKARKVAEKKEALRLWRAEKSLYKVSFPWKQLLMLIGSIILAAIFVFGSYKGIVWWLNSDTISGPFGRLSKTVLEENKFVTLVTSEGDIKLELMPGTAPKTSANFVLLAQNDFYDGVKFHRVIDNFMIQTGDPLSTNDNPNDDGTGGPGYQFNDEFNQNTPKLVRGMLAMANSGVDTNGSQFFIITQDETPHLDGRHTPFGIVLEGMDIVDKIGTTKTDNDKPIKDIIINDVILSSE